jgi:hypothetical protein
MNIMNHKGGLMDTKEIKEAITDIQEGNDMRVARGTAILLDLAQSHLTALESVVEKKAINENYQCLCFADDSGSFECEGCRAKRENEIFNSCHDQLFPHIVQLRERVKELEKELQNCQANHKDLVSRCALLRERPDLPVDRIPAYNELIRLQQLSQQGRVSVEEVAECLEKQGVSAEYVEHVDSDEQWLENSKNYRLKLAQAIVKLVEGER